LRRQTGTDCFTSVRNDKIETDSRNQLQKIITFGDLNQSKRNSSLRKSESIINLSAFITPNNPGASGQSSIKNGLFNQKKSKMKL